MTTRTPTRSELNHAMRAVESSRKSQRGRYISLAILLIIGIMITAYPIVSTLQNNSELSRIADEYADGDKISSDQDGDNDRSISAAHAYNDDLSQRPFTPPPIGFDDTHERYSDYADQLSVHEGAPMASIAIPSVDISLPVYHGTSSETLYKGAGHLYGTHLPVGGKGTTTAISAHTGMVNASMFDNLQYMEYGEYAYIRVRGETLRYKMVSRDIVQPHRKDAVTMDKDRDLMVLITCTPYGMNSDRLVVTLERDENPPYEDSETSEISNTIGSWQPWMSIIVGVMSLIIILIAIQIIRDVRDRRRREKIYLAEKLGA